MTFPNPRTVGDRIAETTVVVNGKELTVNTVLLHPDSSSYVTTIYDDSDDKRHDGMRLGVEWIVGWGQQMGTRCAALSLHEEAVTAARTETPSPLTDPAA